MILCVNPLGRQRTIDLRRFQKGVSNKTPSTLTQLYLMIKSFSATEKRQRRDGGVPPHLSFLVFRLSPGHLSCWRLCGLTLTEVTVSSTTGDLCGLTWEDRRETPGLGQSKLHSPRQMQMFKGTLHHNTNIKTFCYYEWLMDGLKDGLPSCDCHTPLSVIRIHWNVEAVSAVISTSVVCICVFNCVVHIHLLFMTG